MDQHDQDIIARITALADEERDLEESHRGEGLDEAGRQRLSQVEVTLDQLWDLLRQRRALRDSGRDPDQAHERPAGTVEHYLQ